MLTIRTAVPQDLEAITHLEAVCFPPAEAAGKESFAARLAKFGDHFWLLFEDGQLVGMVNGMVTDEETIRDEMFGTQTFIRRAAPGSPFSVWTWCLKKESRATAPC